MKKIGFVTPWFGKNIPGGAEMELRGITKHLHEAGLDIEILTTCVKEFSADWSVNYYETEIEIVDDILVRRFKVGKRDVSAFDNINYKLMNNIKISSKEEQIFVEEMVNSKELYEFIKKNKSEYELFVFIPYMFGTTYFGSQICPEKSILIPCFHNESYFHMNIFKNQYSNVLGMIYNAQSEYELANTYYDFKNTQQIVMGIGMDIDIKGDSNRFIEKYSINDPFILYAGRKDSGKNVHTLVKYFSEFKKRNNNECKLVLIGGGDIEIPGYARKDIIDLGFVDVQDKYDACSASLCLCQPSKNESFSLVIMESWLCEKPVLVNQECDVTRGFVQSSHGGLYFSSYYEFEGCINYYLKNPKIAEIMGNQGRKFVVQNFAWDIIIKKYIGFFENCISFHNEIVV